MKKRGLGRGLKELLGDSLAVKENDLQNSLNIRDISVGSSQPRKFLDNQALKELADSIKVQGLLQPIVVRETVKDKAKPNSQKIEISKSKTDNIIKLLFD